MGFNLYKEFRKQEDNISDWQNDNFESPLTSKLISFNEHLQFIMLDISINRMNVIANDKVLCDQLIQLVPDGFHILEEWAVFWLGEKSPMGRAHSQVSRCTLAKIYSSLGWNDKFKNCVEKICAIHNEPKTTPTLLNFPRAAAINRAYFQYQDLLNELQIGISAPSS